MSTISYGAPAHRSGAKSYQSNALDGLKSLTENYQAEGISILTEGYQDVVNNPTAFAEYVERLTEGTDDATRGAMTQLAENARLMMFQESAISGTNPITALSLPMLRVGWPKIAVREGLPTEPVEQPKFKVTTKRPYVRAANGDKLYLPKSLLNGTADVSLPKLETTAIAAADGMISGYDLLAPISKNAALGDEIDPRFTVTEVVVNFGTIAAPANETRSVNVRLDTNINALVGKVSNAAGTKTAQLVGTVDREHGLLNLTAMGAILISAKVEGFVSSEANNSATQIGFDIDGVDLVIGTAQPIESPINLQQMTDVMNMYQVDATMSHIETMTTVLAHTTDRQGVRFIDDTYTRESEQFTEAFDVEPDTGYALGPTEWREQIKIKFDRLVTKLQNSVGFYSGHAVIFAHPLDAQVVSNVKWVYAATEQVNGVAVDYKVGTFVSSVTTYTLLQSPHFSQGKFRVVFVPADPEHKTLTYFPYSFTTVRGAASSTPSSVNLPSIQMIKRHLFHSFTPLVGTLTIANNA